MRFRVTLPLALLLFFASSALVAANDGTDLAIVNRIRQEALNNSQVMKHLFYLADVNGPRLTNSPGFNAAADWVVLQAKKWGLENAAKEKWEPYGRGWSATSFWARLTEPQFAALIGLPLAWTPGTNGVVSGSPIYAPLHRGDDLDRYRADLENYIAQYKDKLKGKIVFIEEPRRLELQQNPPAKRYSATELADRAAAPEPLEPIAIDLQNPKIPTDPEERRRFFAYAPRYVLEKFRPAREQLRERLTRFLTDEGVRLVVHHSGRGDGGGTIFPPMPGTYRKDASTPPSSIALTPEHYNRIVRLLQDNIPVRMEAQFQAQFYDQTLDSVNIVAEIPGGSKKDEVVIIGAHLDSVEHGTGATDNAAGCAVMLDVMRILKSLNVKMDRTVRMVLWGGEEQGLLGSRAYVKQHFADPVTMETKPEHGKVSIYLNLDNGGGKIRGVYLQGNDMVRPIFESWLAPFRDLGATTVSIRKTGSTDHVSFDEVGLPGFQFIQDSLEYWTRTHHSNMDVYDRIPAADLMQASAVIASIVYHAANRAEMLPRKPLPQPWPADARSKSNGQIRD